MKPIDLRSDTITLPTPSMRKAMANADVGDDVFGEDPTVNRLQEMAADMLGKEAALFVSSGTMGNLVSQITHCGRGDEALLGDQSHVFYYEQGGSAAIGGIHPRILPNRPDGTIDPDLLESAIRPDDVHFPRTRLLILENTHNRCSGAPIDDAYMNRIAGIAAKHNLKIHVDGARIFNAACALGVDPSQLAKEADSITFCLSKGLAAPVGSLVCGQAAFIAKAKRARKVLGGGMRQAGVIAAAGIVALTEMVDRLEQDHEHAGRLARGLNSIDGIHVAMDKVKTNIVYFEMADNGPGGHEFAEMAEKEGVRVLALDQKRLRAVTQYHITQKDVDEAVLGFKRAAGRLKM